MEVGAAARLIVLTGDRKGTTCALPADTPLSIGRHYSNILVLRDEHCSRRHAEIVREEGRWVVRDLESQNGTFVNGDKVPSAMLQDGDEIRIGQVRLLFALGSSQQTLTPPPSPGDTLPEEPASSLLLQTPFQADVLSSLCQFMADAVNENDARRLLRRALEAVREHTQAEVVGFIGLDEQGEPLPKLVLPDASKVDYHLSRTLTQRVQRQRETIWLSSERQQTVSESLMAFTDAICVPLTTQDTLLGALHAYRADQAFSERHVGFCEILGRHLSSSLRLIRLRKQLEAENSWLRIYAPGDRLVGESAAMQKVRQTVERVAPQSSTVLIRGESGVGKELVAQDLHRKSQRRDGPFVVINCAAIPSELMESHLFGHKKGAFTGAQTDHEGFFQQGDEGTVFLDEIGELPPECQAKLLRVLEGRGFTPVGGKGEAVVDVRFLAATNRDLEQEVRSGKFRKDLYFRLKVIEIALPPLRDHPEDIPDLVNYTLAHLATRLRRNLDVTPAALERLRQYHWPGNVRQLRSVLESAAVLAESDILDVQDFHLGPEPAGEAREFAPPSSLNLQELEHWAIGEAMRVSGQRVSEAAKLLGITRDTLYRKIKATEE